MNPEVIWGAAGTRFTLNTCSGKKKLNDMSCAFLCFLQWVWAKQNLSLLFFIAYYSSCEWNFRILRTDGCHQFLPRSYLWDCSPYPTSPSPGDRCGLAKDYAYLNGSDVSAAADCSAALPILSPYASFPSSALVFSALLSLLTLLLRVIGSRDPPLHFTRSPLSSFPIRGSRRRGAAFRLATICDVRSAPLHTHTAPFVSWDNINKITCRSRSVSAWLCSALWCGDVLWASL